MNKINWDDLKFFYAVAEAKNFNTAAKNLSVNQSTVLRRIDNFESSLGYSLFIRERANYRLTDYGRIVYDCCNTLDGQITLLEKKLAAYGSNSCLVEIAVSLPDFVFKYCVSTCLHDFKKNHPNIHIRFHIDNQFCDLSDKQADIVVRLTDNPSLHLADNLYGRLIGEVNLCAYASKDNAVKTNLSWISWGENVNFSKWLSTENYPNFTTGLTIDSILLQENIVQSSDFACILPTCVADESYYLASLPNCIPFKGFDAWVLTHSSLKSMNGISLVMEFLSSCMKKSLKA